MKTTYKPITNLENIVSDVSSAISEGKREFNIRMAYEFDIDVVRNGALFDVTDDAKMWAERECPKELYINHGQYIKDGMEHIIKELKEKPSSNRAIFSLLNQSDISNTGDTPIPSFMVFQTCIDSDTLYCTSYFRALEISTFLRINIEEIRLKIAELSQELPRFNKVRLVIFAFRAYHNSAITPLKKAKIDLMTPIKICKTLENTPFNFSTLLEEKAKDNTVIDLRPLLSLKEALIENKANNSSSKLQNINFDYFISLIDKSIIKGDELKKLRTQHSHHDSIDQVKNDFTECLKKLSKEFEKCR